MITHKIEFFWDGFVVIVEVEYHVAPEEKNDFIKLRGEYAGQEGRFRIPDKILINTFKEFYENEIEASRFNVIRSKNKRDE